MLEIPSDGGFESSRPGAGGGAAPPLMSFTVHFAADQPERAARAETPRDHREDNGSGRSCNPGRRGTFKWLQMGGKGDGRPFQFEADKFKSSQKRRQVGSPDRQSECIYMQIKFYNDY